MGWFKVLNFILFPGDLSKSKVFYYVSVTGSWNPVDKNDRQIREFFRLDRFKIDIKTHASFLR